MTDPSALLLARYITAAVVAASALLRRPLHHGLWFHRFAGGERQLRAGRRQALAGGAAAADCRFGSAISSCSQNGSTTTLTTSFSQCTSDPDAHGNVTTTDGLLLQSAEDPRICSGGLPTMTATILQLQHLEDGLRWFLRERFCPASVSLHWVCDKFVGSPSCIRALRPSVRAEEAASFQRPSRSTPQPAASDGSALRDAA